jgi:hypothetical protein
MEQQELFCYVNGKKCLLPKGRGECTLLEYLRGIKIYIERDLFWKIVMGLGCGQWLLLPPTRLQQQGYEALEQGPTGL